jgi:hypothetical protein
MRLVDGVSHLSTKGRQRGLVFIAGVLASLFATAAQSDELLPPMCVSDLNGRTSYLIYANPDQSNVSVFSEDGATEEAADSMFLIECVSRQGIEIMLRGKYFDPYRPAQKYMVDVVRSDETFTMQEVQAGLRSLGFRAAMTRLPEEHCGCHFLSMESR